ncbi:hypothetical protein KUV80_07720 [Fictibacillus nanhaiensis]|uniref:hypothetical protein n=1 Tax=Fictibacillus nanhaiensis TaxID=742169 RepID=UPI001C961A73|nr:hypothetical protein [Fictibacillus nanhaiensis]MBY6036535.1 hypothetical protein [Fictibacillus nanhaiensis]
MMCKEQEGGIGLPIQNHQLIQADPFVLSKSEVLHAVKDYLRREGYETRSLGELCGIDLAAANEYHTLVIEAQGNHAEHHEKEIVFTGSQLDTHFSRQLVKLLRNYEKNPGKTLVMANPDTPRLRKKAKNIKQALDDLGVVRFWVKDDGSIEWE